MTDDELREWAGRWGVDPDDDPSMLNRIAAAVLRLLADNATLRAQVTGHVERIAAQSELLSRKAEGKKVVVAVAPLIPVFARCGASGVEVKEGAD